MRYWILSAILVNYFLSHTLNAETPLVEVSVNREQKTDGIHYVYTVNNRSDSPIFRIDLGSDNSGNCLELDVVPINILSPAGWGGERLYDETCVFSNMIIWRNNWEQVENSANFYIAPRQSKTGFEVVLKNDSIKYSNCHITLAIERENDGKHLFIVANIGDPKLGGEKTKPM